MTIVEAISVALAGLKANKLRSFLTMLGVIIGVAAVIVVVAIGQGLKQDTIDRIQSMGTNLLMVRPGMGRRGGVSSDTPVISLEIEDADEIKRTVTGVQDVAPQLEGSVQAKYRSLNWRTRIVGSTPEFQTVRSWNLAEGRFFTEAEVRGRKRVCILGSEVVNELFFGRSPIGEWVRINGIPFEVIGAAKETGGSWGSPDNQIAAPLSTVRYRVLGGRNINMIGVAAVNTDAIDKVEKGIEVLLRRRHKLRTGQDNDFTIMKQSQMLESMAEASETMTRLLGGIALVSLLVGGVGIMNIMLVSVTERTREIGIRKAVGARRRDILWQFLIEAIVLSVIGGAIGIGLGVGASYIVSTKAGWTAIVSPSSIIYAFIFSAFVGIVFGLWPAKRGAEMDPITALRAD